MGSAKAQIALEFVIIFSLVVIVFLFFFALIVSQRASVLNQQEFSQLQLIAQDIAQQISLAASAGSGYFSNSSLYSYIGLPIAGMNITSSGLVTVTSQIGTQNSIALAYAKARDVVVNGPLSSNFISVQNYLGNICVDSNCYNLTNQASSVHLSSIPATQNGIYGYLLQAKAISATGNTIGNTLIGFQTTLGNFTDSNAMWFTNYTNANGIAKAFIYQGGSSGLAHVSATAFYQANSLAANLTAWWPMNLGAGASAYDISGNGDTGSMANSSYASPAFSAQFNGASYFKTNTISNSQSITLSAWVYPTSYTANQAVIGQGDVGTGAWELLQNGNKYVFKVYGGTYTNIAFNSVYPNQWSYLAVSYSSTSNLMDIYVDGALEYSYGVGDQSLLSNLPLYIGYPNNDPTATYFTGSLSNVQLYNIAMSQNSIDEIYNLGLSAPPVYGSKLLGWWPLQGSGSDQSSNVNNAVPYGNIDFTSPVSTATENVNASSGYAASFNGLDSYMSLGNSVLLSPEAGPDGNMTLCTWYSVNSLIGYKGPLIKGESSPSNGNGWEYTLDQGGTYQGFTVWSAAGENIASYYTNSPPQTGVWYFACFTYNYAAQKAYYYLNGVQNKAYINTGSGSATAGTGNLIIGSGEGGNSNVSIADLQIYNTTLSKSQIQLLYSEGQQAPPISNHHLVGWWPLDGSANGFSLNHINGTSSNVTYLQYQFNRHGLEQYSLNGYGVSFNGAGNIIAQNSVTVGSNAVSVLAWVYPAVSLTGSSSRTIASFGASGSSSGFFLDESSQSPYDNGEFGVYAGGTLHSVYATDAFPNPDTWYSIAGVYNGSDVNIYVDGKLYSSNTVSGDITLPDNAIYFGGNPGLSSSDFNGVIADVQVYKTALNASQINLLSNLGMPASASINIPLGTV